MNRFVATTGAVVVAAACAVMAGLSGVGRADDEAVPVFGIKLPAGYRDWKLVSVAHEAGKLDDLRAILGNNIAIDAFRQGKQEFPDGTIIARLAWGYVSSTANDKVFGQPQSFVAGAPKEGVQFMVKDSRKYPATAGWGFAQFIDGKPVDAATIGSCFPCHVPAKANDYVYTHYAP
jgi:hypothetical protein